MEKENSKICINFMLPLTCLVQNTSFCLISYPTFDSDSELTEIKQVTDLFLKQNELFRRITSKNFRFFCKNEVNIDAQNKTIYHFVLTNTASLEQTFSCLYKKIIFPESQQEKIMYENLSLQKNLAISEICEVL